MKTTHILCFAAFIFLSTSCKKPKAGFTADKTEAFVGEPIHFFDNEEMRKNCTFIYDFGDGTNSENDQNPLLYYNQFMAPPPNNSASIGSDRNPSHYYLQPGTYEVAQTVSKAKNLEKGKTKQVTARLTVAIKQIQCDFTVTDTVCPINKIVYLKNITELGNANNYANSFSWTIYNSSDPNFSSTGYTMPPNSYASFSGQETFIKFTTTGTWKLMLSQGALNGTISKPKVITIRVI
jgi:PKD repeat protein